jgi:hypothetical protein
MYALSAVLENTIHLSVGIEVSSPYLIKLNRICVCVCVCMCVCVLYTVPRTAYKKLNYKLNSRNYEIYTFIIQLKERGFHFCYCK